MILFAVVIWITFKVLATETFWFYILPYSVLALSCIGIAISVHYEFAEGFWICFGTAAISAGFNWFVNEATGKHDEADGIARELMWKNHKEKEAKKERETYEEERRVGSDLYSLDSSPIAWPKLTTRQFYIIFCVIGMPLVIIIPTLIKYS